MDSFDWIVPQLNPLNLKEVRWHVFEATLFVFFPSPKHQTKTSQTHRKQRKRKKIKKKSTSFLSVHFNEATYFQPDLNKLADWNTVKLINWLNDTQNDLHMAKKNIETNLHHQIAPYKCAEIPLSFVLNLQFIILANKKHENNNKKRRTTISKQPDDDFQQWWCHTIQQFTFASKKTSWKA